MLRVNDTEYQDKTIAKVEPYENGFTMTFEDGLCFGCPKGTPVEPKPGMVARTYGKGFGSRVRGLDLDGVSVFYRTPDEDDAHLKSELYGDTIEEWLSRWDAGWSVWSVSMGGLGPGYEQCIQITAVEIVRELIGGEYRAEDCSDEERWLEMRKKIEDAVLSEMDKRFGLSGAQWGAAMNLALILWRRGPIDALCDPAVRDRLIQVSRRFPDTSTP